MLRYFGAFSDSRRMAEWEGPRSRRSGVYLSGVWAGDCSVERVRRNPCWGRAHIIWSQNGTLAYEKKTVGSLPQKNDDESEIVVTAKKAADCATDYYGLGAITGGVGGALTAAGQPIPGTKPFVTEGSSIGTSLAGLAANKIFGSARASTSLPTIVGSFPKFLTGRSLAIAGTRSYARFAARAVPIVGEVLIAVDALSIGVCTLSN